jgi:hypothetical protein
MVTIAKLRDKYHAAICTQLIHLKEGGKPSMADVNSRLSVAISRNLIKRIPHAIGIKPVKGQTAGLGLEQLTKIFLDEAFRLLQHLRPGQWSFSLHTSISNFDQYNHLSDLAEIIRKNPSIRTALGDYIIAPDIVVARSPVSDSEIDVKKILAKGKDLPRFTPLRAANTTAPTLHASISCKWTIRSDRSQNARTEGLNLIRNRKGHTPHIAVVTGEPMPTRIASVAIGTGDIDCVYHFALHELIEAVSETKDEAAIDSLKIMIEGRRLRDIADLPFDLAL